MKSFFQQQSLWRYAFYILVIFAFLTLSACITLIRKPFRYDNSHIKILLTEAGEFHTPQEFLQIMETSQIKFSVRAQNELISDSMVSAPVAVPVIDPFFNIMSRGTQVRVFSDKPGAEREKFWEAARAYEVEKKWADSKILYEKVINISPDYFKSYTYYGKSLLDQGEYEAAIGQLTKAVALNDIDWEAHLWLGQAHFRSNNILKAKKHLIYAFVLNKRDPHIQETLRFVLRSSALDIRSNRLKQPFYIHNPKKGHVDIVLQKGEGEACMAMATCMAVWKYDEDYIETMLRGRNDSLSLLMFKECIMTQALANSVLVNKNIDLPHTQKYLYAAVLDKLIDAIILWEIAATLDPLTVLVATREQRQEMARYIDIYVFH